MSRTASARLTICLRCQFRLGRRGQLFRRHPIALTKSAPLSTLAIPDAPVAGEDSPKQQWERKEFVKHRGRPGQRTEQRSAVYELDASGKPEEVIVIRESKQNRTGSFYGDTFISDSIDRWESVSAGTKNYSLTQLVADLEAERGVLNQDSVNAHIGSFRPKDVSVLSGKAFADLEDTLFNSFTQAQLAEYITQFEAGSRAGLGDQSSPRRQAAAVVLGQGFWRPGVSQFLETEQESTDSPTMSSNMSKRDTVKYLLEKCWGIILDDAIGQMQLRLKPHELSLLLRESASHGLLKEFSEKYNCRIDVSRSLQVIRITGTMDTAQLFAGKLKYTVERIQCREIDMTPFLRLKQGVKGVDMLERSLIQAVSEFTDTDIRESEDKNKLNVYYFAESPHAPQIATRLLLAPLKLPSCKEYALFSINETDAALYQIGPGVDLPWNERSTSWSRYRSITAKRDGSSDDTGSAAEQRKQSSPRNKKALVARLKKFLKITDPNSKAGGRKDKHQDKGLDEEKSEYLAAKWTDTGDTIISATPGQVLHGSLGQSPVQRLGVKRLMSKNVDRSFLAGVPRLPNLLSTLKPWEGLSREFMNLRFIPSPWMACGLQGGIRFPHLEFNVEIDPLEHRPKFSSVHAFVEDDIADLMIPEGQADLRFRKRTRYQLQNFDLDQSIKQFKELCELQPDSGKMLWTPPGLKVKIPRRLISEDAGMEHEYVTDFWGEECVLVDYLFIGLDVRQLVRFNVYGWKTTYTEVEAGKAGGRRVEFTMFMDRSPLLDVSDHNGTDDAKASKHELPSDFSAFFDSAHRMVDMPEDLVMQGLTPVRKVQSEEGTLSFSD